MRYEVHIGSPREKAVITDIAEVMTRYGAVVSLLAKPKE